METDASTDGTGVVWTVNAGPDADKNTEISCLCPDSNHDLWNVTKCLVKYQIFLIPRAQVTVAATVRTWEEKGEGSDAFWEDCL